MFGTESIFPNYFYVEDEFNNGSFVEVLNPDEQNVVNNEAINKQMDLFNTIIDNSQYLQTTTNVNPNEILSQVNTESKTSTFYDSKNVCTHTDLINNMVINQYYHQTRHKNEPHYSLRPSVGDILCDSQQVDIAEPFYILSGEDSPHYSSTNNLIMISSHIIEHVAQVKDFNNMGIRFVPTCNNVVIEEESTNYLIKYKVIKKNYFNRFISNSFNRKKTLIKKYFRYLSKKKENSLIKVYLRW